MPVPKMGDSISEGVIESYVKQPGEYVEADEIIARIETDKVTVDILSRDSGVILKYFNEEGDTVEVGADFAEIDTEAKAGSGAPAATPPPKKEPEPAPTQAAPTPPPPPPPKAAAPPPPPPPPKAAPAPTPAPAAAAPTPGVTQVVSKKAPEEIAGTRTETRVKMKKIRLTIAKNLKNSQNINASLTTFNEIDMSAIMDMRKSVQEAFTKKHGVKLGFMSAFMKASVQALKEQPIVNAVIDDNDIVYRDFIDISTAVSAPSGLVVPVLRNAQDMSYADFEKTLADLAVKARSGKMTLEDMAGGTFTITNGGVFGSMMGTPIINIPQSAILGMHATKLRPTVVGS